MYSKRLAGIFLIVLLASRAAAQPHTQVVAAPVLTLKDPAAIADFLRQTLILPQDSVEAVYIYDLLQDGYGAGDVALLLPERSVHVLDLMPEALVARLREQQQGNVTINLEYGRAGTLSPLAAFAESFDQLVRAYYDGQSLAATILWRPNRAQVTVWGANLEQMKMTTWEEIASAGGVAYPVTFRSRGRREGTVRMWYDGTECKQLIDLENRQIIKPCR